MCPCNTDIMAAEHLLQHCQLRDALRRDMWPEPTLLRGNLYGGAEENSYFREDGRHLRLAYNEEEEQEKEAVFFSLSMSP